MISMKFSLVNIKLQALNRSPIKEDRKTRPTIIYVNI
jgi:hypothetical protein